MLSPLKSEQKNKKSIPLYLQIADELKERILRGELPDGSRLPAESELARTFGVNHLTVRKGVRVLSEQNLIIQQHGRGNFVSYSGSCHLKIGLVNAARQPYGHYKMFFALELVKELGRIGSSAIFLQINGEDKDDFLRQYNESGCHGLVVLSPTDRIIKFFSSDEFKYIPVCFITSAISADIFDMHCRIGLKQESARDGISYLQALGHHKIGYISAESRSHFSLIERNRIFRDCLRDEKMIFLSGVQTLWYDWGRKCMQKIAAMPKDQRPTAVVCAGLVFAAGAWCGAMENNLRIPEDISVLSFESDELLFPELSSLEQPLTEYVKKAIAFIKNAKLSGGLHKNENYEYDASIKERGSCCRLEKQHI